MRRVFKTRYFSRWMRKSELTDSALCTAVAEMATGLIDADLLRLGSSELDEHVASEALKEICHDNEG